MKLHEQNIGMHPSALLRSFRMRVSEQLAGAQRRSSHEAKAGVSIYSPMRVFLVLILACWFGNANAQLADLSNWVAADYPDGVGGYEPSIWELVDPLNQSPPGTTAVRQNEGATVATVFHSDFIISHTSIPGISGQMKDFKNYGDDQIGFVFGFQDLNHHYLFQWKRGGDIDCANFASIGMHVRRVDVPPGGTISSDDLEGCENTPNSTILFKNNDVVWNGYKTYSFTVSFQASGFRITIFEGATEIADFTINDLTYRYGKIGFYNASQEGILYTMDEVPVARLHLTEAELGTSAGPVLAEFSGITEGDYDIFAQNVAMIPGSLTLNYDIGPNPGDELYTHTFNEAAWDLLSGGVTVSSFDCSEGTYGASQNEFLCANTSFGADTVNDSTTDYSVVPGTRVIGGDDAAIGLQLQATDYGLLQPSWDGSQLVAESAAWTANPGLAGYRLTFSAPNPLPVGLLLARHGTPDGVEEAAAAGDIAASYDPALSKLVMVSGAISIPYATSLDSATFTHTLADANWNLRTTSIAYTGFDCAEGTHGATLNRFLCANTSFGPDLINATTTDYSVDPGTRQVGGDDMTTGIQVQGAEYAMNQVSWDGTTLVLESPDWTANPDGSGGATAGYQLTFVYGSPPAVDITAPPTSTILVEALPINLIATANDAEDGDLTAQIQWSSDIDGPVTNPAQLSVGAHVLTASTTDSSGLTGSDSTNVTIANGPMLTINAPTSGTEFVEGATISLQGTATDVEDGDISGSIQWTSSLSGSLGSGSPLPANLVPGVHVISAAVADSDLNSPLQTPTTLVVVQQDSNANGLSDNWEITYSISDPAGDDDGDTIINIDEYTGGTIPIDAAPQVSIQLPGSGYAASPGEAVNFSASATDTEDGDISAAVSWSSNLDGSLGTGAMIFSELSLGLHTITATVTDSSGSRPVMDATIQVGVNMPAVGDMNGDGQLDISDLLMLQQVLLTP